MSFPHIWEAKSNYHPICSGQARITQTALKPGFHKIKKNTKKKKENAPPHTHFGLNYKRRSAEISYFLSRCVSFSQWASGRTAAAGRMAQTKGIIGWRNEVGVRTTTAAAASPVRLQTHSLTFQHIFYFQDPDLIRHKPKHHPSQWISHQIPKRTE